jgi:hypothetical protein
MYQILKSVNNINILKNVERKIIFIEERKLKEVIETITCGVLLLIL